MHSYHGGYPTISLTIIVFYLLVLYLLALPNTPENPFASIYSESLIKTACQYLLLLVGFDTLIYQKYYDTPPILVGHHRQRPILGDRSLYSGTLPGRGIAPGAISIDSTAISINVVVSYDEERVVLPRG
jgi:hypothetical protein